MIYHFADCALDTQLYTLYRRDQSTRLAPKVFEVLCYLIEQRNRVVSKQELCERIWAGLAISDATLESCLRAVRLAVGDSGHAQRIIQTQRGYGYRFVLEVTLKGSTSATETRAALTPLAPQTEPGSASFSALSHMVQPPVPLPVAQCCSVCQHINNEQALFCAACGTRLRQLCAHCGQSVTLPAIFCTACGQALTAPAPPAPPPALSVQAERKSVTVLCCAVATTTPAAGRVDLDALHSLLLTLHALAQEVVRQYGGQLSPVMGERLMAMFGVPVAHEDDARRAVRVALELRRRISAQRLRDMPEVSLTLRMGLHTGLVMVSGLHDGDAADTSATVVGDVLSVAALLQERATPGAIVCSDATARLLQGLVSLESLGPLQAPGQPGPLETYTVLARHVRRAPVEPLRGRILSPFVGREREMTTLHALLAQVEEGRGQVVGVVGEPGLGKSRLVYEFRRSLVERTRRLAYRAGRCLSYGSTTPYLPVLDLLRYHCGISLTDTPEDATAKIHRGLQDVGMAPETWAPVLLHLLGLQEDPPSLAELSPEARKARTLTAIAQMCLQGSRRRPLILAIEDLHWIDASSDECLAALVERMAGAPLMILVTYRPEYRPAWMDHSYVTQLALQPLTRKDSLQVVQAVLPTAAITTPFMPPLLSKANGNPFFLEELAHTVAEQGAEASALAVPDTVQAVLLSRIDRLPATAKRLLQAAAVIGKDVALPLLRLVTEVPEQSLERDLGSLQAAEFLYETQATPASVYTFKHALTQEVAYQSLGRQARQQYHERVAQVLEAHFPELIEKQPELLAQHYTEAEQAAHAIPYWQRAGQKAVERSANVEAISHFTKGLELLKSLPETPERLQQELALLVTLGPALLASKGYTASEAERVYNRALALCQHVEDDPQHFLVLVGLWRFYLNRGQLQAAHRLGEQGFAIAQRLQEPWCRQEAHQMLGSTFFYMGNPIAARLHLEQGIALSSPQRDPLRGFTSGVDTEVMCRARAAWVLWILGYPDQALARVYEALYLARQLSHSHSLACALHYAALLHQCRREPRLAQEQAEAAIALSREYGFVQWLLGGMFVRGWALAQQGGMEEGIAQLRYAMSSWHEIGTDIAQMHILVRLAEAYKMGGRYAEGLRALHEARSMKDQNEARYYEAELYRLTGELLLHASSVADTATPLASVSPPVQAEANFLQALHIARLQQTKLLELRAVLSLSRLWSTQGKPREARNMLQETLHWFSEGFETPDLQEAKALLDTLGELTGGARG